MRLFLLFATLITPWIAQAQIIQGRVIDSETGAPLDRVAVMVETTSIGTTTDKTGVYTLHAGTGTLVVITSRLGYEPASRVVTVPGSGSTVADFRLVATAISIPEIVVESQSMTGGVRGVDRIPGSAHFVTARSLHRFAQTDAHRALRSVPGVTVQEEDGYGLRPNIGMRGSGSERSSKITIMEDGILMSPAPYASPAAYYFPTIGRMHGIEVRKGSSQIRYGPFTTGGAINLISTPVPTDFQGEARLLAGSDANRLAHVTIGNQIGRVGFLLETHQARTDGFKLIDGGGNTGFDKKDYIAKLQFSSRPGARVPQRFQVKVGRVDERSHETYLGLTSTDFDANPLRRYAGSAADRMDADQQQYVVTWLARPSSSIRVTASAYATRFHRNWYKLDKVIAGESIGIADLLDSPVEHAAQFAVVSGQALLPTHELSVKANNRTYRSRGVQADVVWDASGMQLQSGLRIHADEMDRFQWADGYVMDAGRMTLARPGEPGTDSNRLESANAAAAYVQSEIALGRITLTPGVRLETVVQRRDDYGKSDPGRTGANLSTRRNTASSLLPGMGISYEPSTGIIVFGGVHRGFAPPGTSVGAKPESSTNVEAGTRFVRGSSAAEVVAFATRYRNLLGSDLAAAGGTGSMDLFNGGRAAVTGLEISGSHNLGHLLDWAVSLPMRVAYTFTDGRFSSDFESTFGPWGSVQSGDKLPYVPVHQVSFESSVESSRWEVSISGSYTGTMRTEAGHGTPGVDERVDDHVVVDVSAEAVVGRGVRSFVTVRNVFDTVYVAARRPAGLRPGLPRMVLAGLRLSL